MNATNQRKDHFNSPIVEKHLPVVEEALTIYSRDELIAKSFLFISGGLNCDNESELNIEKIKETAKAILTGTEY